MSQLRCNGKVPTIVFGEVARDIVACKEVVDWLQYPVPGFEDFIVIITDSAVEYEERIDAFLQSVVNGRLYYMVLDMNDSLDRQRFRNKWMSFLPKPFVMGELLSRVRAMLRRKDRFTPDIMTFGNVSLNLSSCELKGPLQSIVLPKIEYKLMELLMLNKGIYLSTDDILVKVWGYESDAESGAVWVYISYVRKRLAAIGADIEIRAKRSVGYTLAKIGDAD